MATPLPRRAARAIEDNAMNWSFGMMMRMTKALSAPFRLLAVCGFFCLPLLVSANAATNDQIQFNSLSGAYLAARTADAAR